MYEVKTLDFSKRGSRGIVADLRHLKPLTCLGLIGFSKFGSRLLWEALQAVSYVWSA